MVPRRSRAGFPASDGGRNTVFLMVISPRKPASPRSLYHPGRRMSCHATSRGSMFLDSGQSHAINGSHSWWASATASYPSAWYHRSRSATESRLLFDATPSPRYGSRLASASGNARNVSMSIQDSIGEPPNEMFNRPTGTPSHWRILRPKKYASAEKSSSVSASQPCQNARS